MKLTFLFVSLIYLSSFSYKLLASSVLENNENQDWNFSVGINAVGINENVSTYSIPKAEMARHVINVSGRPLHFLEVYRDRQKGPKPLIIFVHGTPGAWFDYAAFLGSDYMRDNFHMISIDRLGHGGSNGKVESSLKAQAAALKPLFERNTTNKGAILVGHSYGGPVVARAAMDHADDVSGLVFIASTADPKRSRRWYNTAAGIPPICWLLPRELARSNREILPLKRELKAILPLWQNITVPTTIIQGGKDKLVKAKNANFIQKSLSNAKVEMIFDAEADHFIHWRNPQLLIDALMRFIPSSNTEAAQQ